ncbi:MAG: NADH-quinone oxidoreductase subunit M [Gemmatales bacterium]|nr:NADH-quinone oxidoreductase subunit M [Gemmatales bacterium]MDW7995141.1 NADH-quinone oxidoreductase subunit M [Gemmatales bacterium]
MSYEAGRFFEYDLWLMSGIIFLPSLFALILLFIPKGQENWMRITALAGTVLTLLLSVFLLVDWYHLLDTYRYSGQDGHTLAARADQARLQEAARGHLDNDLIARRPWIGRFNIDYFLGADGISVPLVVLTALICVLAIGASWNIENAVRGYLILFLILETGMMGTFLALDFFLFYVFWEVMLLPMYFLIGLWGGPRREYAAIKFFLFTLFGSVLMLIAMIAFYFADIAPLRDWLVLRSAATGSAELRRESQAVDLAVRQRQARGEKTLNTFDILLLHKVGRESAYLEAQYQQAEAQYEEALASRDAQRIEQARQQRDEARRKKLNFQIFSPNFQIVMFVLLFIGFAIKLPMVPFHTWLPDAHVEAPTPISMILAGILLKMGGYGFLRIAYPICPWAAYVLAWWIALFGVISIVYGAFAAMAQTDFKKLVAYSSISHMGYVQLGIAIWTSIERSQFWNWGMNGAMFQMLAHGLSSPGMFFMVGVIYDRLHHRDLDRMGGLANAMPLYAGLSAIIFFAAMGLPGLCGFPGEFFTVLGTWNFTPPGYEWAGKVFAILAAATVIITAGYILWTVQRVYLGHRPPSPDLPEITFREFLCALPIVVLAILLGVWPRAVLDWVEPSLAALLRDLASIHGG